MNNSGKHILIVDDNIKNLQITAKILKDEGYLISLAQDAKSALAQLDQLIPDMLLLDIMMPEMDGLELCRILKKDPRFTDIPVIFLTARTQTDDLEEGFNAGGVDYITKPFKRAELLTRVKNHIELAGSRNRIMHMNRTRDKLYSVIAHDIRSPLSSISLAISSLANGYLEPGTEEYDEIIHYLDRTATETQTLLDNLLSYTRMQDKEIAVAPEELELLPVIAECIQLLQANADNKKINIDVNIPEGLNAYFDEVTMQAVFRNMIFNSIKFTPDNGKVSISAVNAGDTVEIKVKDNGVGISKDLVEKIFVKNEHFTSPGTDSEHGSGLGSFIIKDFISRNSGTIDVKSTPGKGTEMIVVLPANKKE
ncbi:MAG TPA: hybrid sensor histidine kinase/response regulator [Bacteroidales bacterium]|nr:hybrid sensor histidine kinase/response regulator [Bacteroidales bacterium]